MRPPIPLLTLLASTTYAKSIDVPWSKKKYGPDGPWQAVQIKVGGNDPSLIIDAQNHANIDAYPGGSYSCFTFSKDACDPYPNSDCGIGGTWEPDKGATDLISSYVCSLSSPINSP
jgi:hypothetical protein